ncbi:uncharacterized protein TNCV_1527811 [Trichonephila clavipes]|nr:uncharacterized protein TNCV_1527811 [Trichonephila clavipes]
MQRLTTLAFSDFSANVREMIYLEYFVDGLKDEEIQMAVRMADFKDLKSALLYALKVETAIQASCIDYHSIQEARATADEPCESRCIKGIEKLKEEMQALIAERQNRRRRSITCWGIQRVVRRKAQLARHQPFPSYNEVLLGSLGLSLHLRSGVLYRKWESDDGKTFRWQLILLKIRVSTVLKELHGSPTGGHFGVMKTLQKFRERFYWNNVRSDVENCCHTCDPCASRKVPENALEEDCSYIMWERLSNE